MADHIAFLNIGSNLGSRRLNLSRAVAELEKVFGYFELSHSVESKPLGYDSPNDFLNIGMMVRTEMEPAEILRRIKEVEKGICSDSHRNPDGSYADRIIDIDLIAVDQIVMQSDELTLPHPRMQERAFVLRPMEELAPGWRHPLSGKSPAEMLAMLPAEEKPAN